MRLKEMNIYQLAYWVTDIKSFFTKDNNIKKLNEDINKGISKDVFNPELSKGGLRQRQLYITVVAGSLGQIALLFIFLFWLPIAFFTNNYFLSDLTMAIFFAILSSAIYICLIRGCRASLDEIKFKRQGEPESFKLNERAYIRWYDFLSGIPIGVISFIWW